jgi:hypothetical protein
MINCQTINNKIVAFFVFKLKSEPGIPIKKPTDNQQYHINWCLSSDIFYFG